MSRSKPKPEEMFEILDYHLADKSDRIDCIQYNGTIRTDFSYIQFDLKNKKVCFGVGTGFQQDIEVCLDLTLLSVIWQQMQELGWI